MNIYRKNSILNLVFTYSQILFNVVTGVFLVPYYLSKLSLEVYGSFIVAVGIANLIGMLEFGLSMVTTQRLAKYYAQEQFNLFRQTTYIGISISTLLFVLICITTLIVSTAIPWVTKVNPEFAKDLQIGFVLLGLAAGANVYMSFIGSIFQALLKAGTLGMIHFFSSIIGVITLVFYFNNYGSLTAIAMGTFVRALCATSLLSIVAIVSLNRASLIPQKASLKDINLIIHDCVPIFIGGIAKSIAENAQNLIMVSAVSSTSVAILSLTQKAFQICNMILAPIGSSIYSNLTQIKEKTSSVNFSNLLAISIRGHFLLAVILIAAAIVFNESFVSLWVGHKNFGGNKINIMIGISFLIQARFGLFSFLTYCTGNFKEPLRLEISYSIAKIILLFLFIDAFGLLAVPMAEIFSGIIFLYLFSTFSMQKNLTNSIFSKGIYYSGLLEFIIIITTGKILIYWLDIDENLIKYFLVIIAHLIFSLFLIVILNASFLKSAVTFRRAKLSGN